MSLKDWPSMSSSGIVLSRQSRIAPVIQEPADGHGMGGRSSIPHAEVSPTCNAAGLRHQSFP
mgnify:CR=1 FL=1